MKKTIGILYICTGPYALFWEDFYKSFEENFITEYEKKYFVFTDAEHIYNEHDANVYKVMIENQPWPLITLFRFSFFLKIENMLSSCDYLMFSNANMVCGKRISADEFLPRIDKGENISVTLHPGYYEISNIYYPYERNKKSTAYIPWNCGDKYVIGAMYAGTRKAFLEMSKSLKKSIEEDLKSNLIAVFHDESQLNRYILKRNDVRFLSPAYCYPDKAVLMYMPNINYESKIYAVSKQEKFDVKTFKGHYEKRRGKILKLLAAIYRQINFKGRCFKLRDYILRRDVKEIKNAK